jgi:fibronectin type 3 domain-containing protein
VAGQTDGTLPGQTKSGVWDPFVRKYDAAGTELWTRQFGTSGSLLTWADAADASGVYVAGEGFVRKYDASGLEVWTQWFSATVYAAAADSSGVYVAGWAIGALPGSVGTGHVFVRKYDMFGRQGWTFQFGTTGSTEAHAVAIDSTQLYVAGRTNGAFPGQMNSGDFDAFLTGFGEAKVPLSPSITQAAPGDTTVALAWSAPTFDGGTPITNYTIYRGTSVATLVLLTTVGQALTYPDTAVTNGVTYYYQVSAVNAVGEGPRSNEASSTPVGRPSAPLSLRARGGDGNVTLTWQTPSSDGGYAISYYRVYQGMSSSVLSPRAVVASSTLSYTDASLTNGLTFYYQTTAVNALGEGPRSREVSATPVRPDTTPPTIEIIAPLQGAILSSSAVRVTGTASDDVAVEQVEVSLDGTTWVLATGTTLWSIPLTLREGSNTITARATDASGNAVSTTVVVTVVGALILFGSVAGAGIVLVAAIYLLRRRKRRGAEPPPGATPPVA